MRALIIEPVESLSLSSSPITGIDLLTYVSPLSLPLSTTIVGAIGSLLNVKLKSQDPVEGLEELANILIEKLRCRKPIIAGPLTQFSYRNAWSKPMVNIGWRLFVNPDCITNDYTIDVDSCSEAQGLAEFSPIIATGVSLERTVTEKHVEGAKKARVGYFYKYPMLSYTIIAGKTREVAKPRFIYAFNCDECIEGYTRVGGEGRIARVYTQDIEVEGEIMSPLSISEGTFIALSPIPILPLRNDLLLLEPQDVAGLEFVTEIIGVPRGDRGLPHKILVERLGLGFYEVKKIRRPQIISLPPGTIIKTGGSTKSVQDPLLRILYTIGFASLYKLRT